MTYPIIQLDENAPTQLEQLGTKTKFWYFNHEGRSMLFKEGRPGTGENWAEKVCNEICILLGIPCASYDLATWKGRKGVTTPMFVPKNGRLVLGNELLSKVINDYEVGARYKVRQHTVRIVMAVATSSLVYLPRDWKAPYQINDSGGVFTAYLMLDALVSNQDRHHENWGVVYVPEQGVFLAPTFDHAASLGRNESDLIRIEMLNTRDKGRTVESFVARAKSALFASQQSVKPLGTLEAFLEAAKLCPLAAEYWVNQLRKVTRDDYMTILRKVPDTEISEPARDFACAMLETNAKRIFQNRTISI